MTSVPSCRSPPSLDRLLWSSVFHLFDLTSVFGDEYSVFDLPYLPVPVHVPIPGILLKPVHLLSLPCLSSTLPSLANITTKGTWWPAVLTWTVMLRHFDWNSSILDHFDTLLQELFLSLTVWVRSNRKLKRKQELRLPRFIKSTSIYQTTLNVLCKENALRLPSISASPFIL